MEYLDKQSAKTAADEANCSVLKFYRGYADGIDRRE
jgi:hypothetical protein